MKKIILGGLLAFIAFPVSADSGSPIYQTAPTQALTGNTKLACEAVLCLSSGTRPSECSPSLAKYFGITDPRPHKMIEKRLNFLKLCPASSQPKMPELIDAISKGAGRCDAKFLNTHNKKTITYREYERVYEDGRYKWEWVTKEKEVISSKAPNYCQIYETHEFTDLVTAKYVGSELEDGRWYDAKDYDKGLIEYQEEQEAKKLNEARKKQGFGYYR